jgi:hypothetical protein
MKQEMSLEKRFNAFWEMESRWWDHPNLAEHNSFQRELWQGSN